MTEISPSFAFGSGMSGGPYVKKLTSVKDNIRVEEWAGAADLASGARDGRSEDDAARRQAGGWISSSSTMGG
jgi:hypothetical protein